jgi:hypothetical protein
VGHPNKCTMVRGGTMSHMLATARDEHKHKHEHEHKHDLNPLSLVDGIMDLR